MEGSESLIGRAWQRMQRKLVMNALFVAVLLFASLQGSPARREIATGDWSNIPLIENRTFPVSQDGIST
jgi:hypothetical protein